MTKLTPNAETTMAVSRFELRLQQNRVPESKNSLHPNPAEVHIYAEIWIDELLLDEPHTVCVMSVLTAFARANPKGWNHAWHEVFTCGCGTAGCANIYEGVGVSHTDEHVDWVFRRPQANRYGSDPIGYKTWCETALWYQFRFDRHLATRELIRFLDEAWLVLKASDIKVSNEAEVLNWFDNDPRSPMRCRGSEWAA